MHAKKRKNTPLGGSNIQDALTSKDEKLFHNGVDYEVSSYDFKQFKVVKVKHRTIGTMISKIPLKAKVELQLKSIGCITGVCRKTALEFPENITLVQGEFPTYDELLLELKNRDIVPRYIAMNPVTLDSFLTDIGLLGLAGLNKLTALLSDALKLKISILPAAEMNDGEIFIAGQHSFFGYITNDKDGQVWEFVLIAGMSLTAAVDAGDSWSSRIEIMKDPHSWEVTTNAKESKFRILVGTKK